MTPNHSELVAIPSGSVKMEGMLELPNAAEGVVLFAHGSGSSRLSPRNNFVAKKLHEVLIGTLLIDLLSEEEDLDYKTRFDISLLTARLGDAATWLRNHHGTGILPLGLFGASTGAAAALQLAALGHHGVGAVVSRGGRPDLASAAALQTVRAPTLLIVGGDDTVVIELNRQAYDLLQCDKEMVIVPGATHLFEEPGKLEEVAELARGWFLNRMVAA
jgi:pimeloyl-ACP methyl ester carboxylesterase